MQALEGDRRMARQPTAWIVGFTLLAGAASATAMADGTIFGLYNPLGVYVGGGIGRSSLNQIQFDQFVDDIQHIDAQPLGWNAVVGIRPIPFLGAEAEYIDFGNHNIGPGQSFLVSGYTQQFLGGQVHDRAPRSLRWAICRYRFHGLNPSASSASPRSMIARAMASTTAASSTARSGCRIPLTPAARPTAGACSFTSNSSRSAPSTSASVAQDRSEAGTTRPCCRSE